MNQRIHELIRQSVVPADQAESYALAKGLIEPTEKLDVAKFAELIVRECADVLVENGDKQFNIRTVEPESHTKTTDWLEGYEEAVKHYGSFLLKKNAKLIKKHFGVEQ